MLMHEEKKKKHACTQCPHRFLYKSQLNGHMEVHGGGQRLTCPSRSCAGKTFQNKDMLKRHMEIHKVEKNVCPL